MPDPPANIPVTNASPLRSGGRPARTRFGPPVKPVEGKLDLTSQRGQTPESPQSHHFDDRATSPPLSRDSSVTSLRDAHTSMRHEAGSLRPQVPRVPESRSSAIERKEEQDILDRRSGGRNDHHGRSPTSRAHTAEKRMDESQWSRSQDPPPQDSSPPCTAMESVPSGQQAPNVEGLEVQQSSLPPVMHPERARLLQKGTLSHALPPRPETEPRRPRVARPRYSDSGQAPVHPRSNQPSEYNSFRGDRHDRPPNNHGASLIDRIGVGGGDSSFSSLRDRVKVPMKRPQDDMAANEGMDVDDGHEGKRSRRRGGKLRKPRRT